MIHVIVIIGDAQFSYFKQLVQAANMDDLSSAI